MKSILKVVMYIGIIILVLMGITLFAWASWQVMPDNPHRYEWRWNLPPFPLAIAVWFVGIPMLGVTVFGGFGLGMILIGVFGLIKGIVRRPAKRALSQTQDEAQ